MTEPVPSSSPSMQSAHPEPRASLPMPLLMVFQETLLLMGRYFIILYPLIFFYFIGSIMLLPNAVPDFNYWAWWVILLGIPAIGFLLRAGWQALLYQCIQEWQFLKTQVKDETDKDVVLKHMPLSLLKYFIPGVGEYGASFLVGNFGWLILSLAPLALVVWWAYASVGVPPTIEKLLLMAGQNQVVSDSQINAMLQSVSDKEHLQIGQWGLSFLLGLMAMSVFHLMTQFWQQYLIIKRCSPFRAMLYSLQHLIRYPLHSLVIFTAFFSITLLAALIGGTSMVGSFIAHFMLILLIVYSGLFTYLYLDYLHVRQAHP